MKKSRQNWARAAFFKKLASVEVCGLILTGLVFFASEAKGGGGGGGSTTRTWTGGAGNGNWNEGSNWDEFENSGNPGAPESGDPLIFSGNTNTVTNNNLTGANPDWLVPSIEFANDGAAVGTQSFELNSQGFDLGLGAAGDGPGIRTEPVSTGLPITDVINLDMELFSGSAVEFDIGLNHNLRSTEFF